MRKPKTITCFQLLFLFFLFFPQSFFMFPRENGPQPSGYIHKAWEIEDGLPQNFVNSILQTRDGYIWVGTEEGLARFDCIKFVTFPIDNTPGINIKYINALLQDRSGNLWIGSNEGLVCFKDGTFTSRGPKTGAPSPGVYSLCEGRGGIIWIGTARGLFRLKEGKYNAFYQHTILTKYGVRALHEDRSGILWIGTQGGGLLRFQKGLFTSYGKSQGLLHPIVNALHQDREGNLWIGTREGLNRLKNGTLNGKLDSFTVQGEANAGYIISIYQDKSGGIWVGTWEGLKRFIDGKLVDYTTEDGPFKEAVPSIAEDREGNLWLGTGSSGLVRLKPAIFKTYTTKNGLPGNFVFPILQDRKGTVWLGIMGKGLTRWKNGTFKTFTVKNGLSGNYVRTISEDQRGNIWIGTMGNGLNRFADNKFTRYTKKDGLSSNYITTLFASRDGTVWIGTSNHGLDGFKEGRFTNYSTSNGLPHNYIKSIYEDSKGYLWIATNSGGLVRFKNGIFRNYSNKDDNTGELSFNHNIITMYEDKEDNLWLGTYGGGLIRLSKGSFTAYTTKEGLFNNNIYRILEDEKRNLWLSCNKGIFRVNKQEFTDYDLGKSDWIRCHSYGKADGMKSSECNGNYTPSGWKTRDGKLWFPTVKGVLVVDPDRVETNTVVPPVIIEKIRIDDRLTELLQHTQISPGKRRFEFFYTAPSFVAPKRMKFKYMLQGFDDGWISADSQMDRTACYTNISPGDYCFRVIACNNDGVWNETGASFHFTLKPFFYQTSWFYGICVLCLLATGIGIHRLRVKQILVNERMKYQKVRLAPEDAEKYLKRILHLMENEKPYLDPGISLSGLSKRTGIPEHYLSQVINGKLNRNFFDFINHYRTREASRLLADPRNHLTITEIALEVGFYSRSAFNRAFNKHIKMTPSDFKKAKLPARN